MPPRWLLAATLLAVAAPPARGETPSIELGYLGPQVTIDQVLVVLRDEPRPMTAHVVLSLSATHVARRELTATLRLPPGTRVTSFAYTGGEDARRVAVPTPAPRAGESYAALRAWHGGALAEATGPDQLALRVPIAADHRAEIELELALPPVSALAIDPGGQTVRRAELRREGAPRRIRDDLAEPWTIALPRASAPPARSSAPPDPPGAPPPPAGVSSAMSLLIGDVPQIVIGPATSTCDCRGGARDVRRIVRLHHPQLRHCYMRVAQWNPRIAGTAVLHFRIAEDGRVKSSSVDGDLGDADIERCLADEVARWEFSAAPGGGEIQVNYPVTFRIAR